MTKNCCPLPVALAGIGSRRPRRRHELGVYAPVSNLPPSLQKLLNELGYRRKDIDVVPAETFNPSYPSGEGHRAFVSVVNLATGSYRTTRGSWGGANPFERGNIVDDSRGADVPIPPNGAVVIGSEGGGHPIYATVHVRPEALAPLLPPAQSDDLGEIERVALVAYKDYNSKGRLQCKERIGDKRWGDAIAGLVRRGLLKSNAAGAASITTEGKNTAETIRRTVDLWRYC